MSKRYKLPESLGGGEYEANGEMAGVVGIELVGFTIDGSVMWLPLSLLTEVKPPLPEEPEPGAYLIGDTICVRVDVARELARHRNLRSPKNGAAWAVGAAVPRTGWFNWAETLDLCGGPDVAIIPLVPALEPVSLPWIAECDADTGMVLEIREEDTDGHVPVIIRGSATVYLTREDVRDAARALLTAAGDL